MQKSQLTYFSTSFFIIYNPLLRIFIFVLFFADCQPQAPPADCCGCDADAAEKKDGAKAKCCGCDKKDGAAAAGGEAAAPVVEAPKEEEVDALEGGMDMFGGGGGGGDY